MWIRSSLLMRCVYEAETCTIHSLTLGPVLYCMGMQTALARLKEFYARSS